MIQEAGIDLSRIEPEALDMPFGLSSGAGAIFGVTGGVTEAVLRRLKNNSSSEVLDAISFTGIRGVDGIKEASVDLNGREVKNCSRKWTALRQRTAGSDERRRSAL